MGCNSSSGQDVKNGEKDGELKVPADALKYSYFPLRARGLPGLLVFEVGGVPYNAEVVQLAEWAEYKTCPRRGPPMGYLPLLTLPDGTKINEICAIVNTIGRRAKLQGDDVKEYAISDMLNHKAAEVMNGAVKAFPSVLNVNDWTPEKTEEGKKWVAGPLAQDLAKFEALCKDAKFTKSGKTCGELHLFSTLHQIVHAGATLPTNLQAFYQRLRDEAGVKKCLTNETKMGDQGDYLMPFFPGHLKFTYFPLLARGLPGLLALEVGRLEYEPEIVNLQDWSVVKATGRAPMGYLPMLTLSDGTVVNEICAIVNIIGRRGNLQGQGVTEYAISDMLNHKAADVLNVAATKMAHILTVKDWTAEKTKAGKEWIDGGLAAELAKFEALCKDDKFTSSGMTCGELHLFSTLHQLKSGGATLPEKLTKFYDRLAAEELVKKCITHKTKFGEQGDYLVPFPK